MIDFLVNPGMPGYLVALMGLVLMAWSIRLQRPKVVGLMPAPSTWNQQQRFAVGQIAGLLCALLILVPTYAHAVAGTTLYLMLASAFAVYLYAGLVLPRKEKVAADKRRQAIRKLTPGFIAYVRVAIAGFDTPAVILERYTARPDKRSAPMREVTAAALDVMQRQRVRPFTALRDEARKTGCQELVDLTEALAQAESEGADVTAALEQHEQTLLLVLEDEFKRMLKRRTMYLLLFVAISVVVGILGNLLYVMVGSVFFKGIGV